jgi:hypothetical protein
MVRFWCATSSTHMHACSDVRMHARTVAATRPGDAVFCLAASALRCGQVSSARLVRKRSPWLCARS